MLERAFNRIAGREGLRSHEDYDEDMADDIENQNQFDSEVLFHIAGALNGLYLLSFSSRLCASFSLAAVLLQVF